MADAREEFRVLDDYLAKNGLKHSKQREIVLQHFLDTGGHMTVDDLYRVIHRKNPRIGRTTIYRALKVFVDATSRPYLNGTTVDYVDSLQGSGFKISNPNSTSSCGCGESFSV